MVASTKDCAQQSCQANSSLADGEWMTVDFVNKRQMAAKNTADLDFHGEQFHATPTDYSRWDHFQSSSDGESGLSFRADDDDDENDMDGDTLIEDECEAYGAYLGPEADEDDEDEKDGQGDDEKGCDKR